MRKEILLLGLAWTMLLLPQEAGAQNRSLVEEMQQRMLQMQREMMQGLQGFGDEDSSGVYFHFDTTFTDDGGAHFFRFTPPGDSTMSGSAPELERFFRDLFDFNGPSGAAAPRSFPKDDGNLPHPDDEMLPEERLRQEEQQPAAAPNTPAPPAKPKATPARKKPSVESIRT